MNEIDKVFEEIKKGVVEAISDRELISKISNNFIMKIKVGFDPTAPDLHLGHLVVLNKLKLFQNFGHEVIIVIGDFTAKIGDPTNRTVLRPILSDEDVKFNAQTYEKQIAKVLDLEKTKIVFNSEWLSKLNAEEFIKLASMSTVARMLERNDFEKRYKSNISISIHEFLYPLLQGYDSLKIESDVEIGGTDQKFNMLVGRDIQKNYGLKKEQIVLTMPLLEGLDGIKKMSKSLGNYVGITEEPDEIFGKLMSISDVLMWRYLELLSIKSLYEISELQKKVEMKKLNPMDIKMDFAREIVAKFYDMKTADSVCDEFLLKFRKKVISTNIEQCEYKINIDEIFIVDLLKNLNLVQSVSEAKRLIQQGGLKINGKKITDCKLKIKSNTSFICQIGRKKIVKIILKA